MKQVHVDGGTVTVTDAAELFGYTLVNRLPAAHALRAAEVLAQRGECSGRRGIASGGGAGGLRSDDALDRVRRTMAAPATSAGANVEVVQRMLGHATAAMTLDRYGHLLDDDIAAVYGRFAGWRWEHIRS